MRVALFSFPAKEIIGIVDDIKTIKLFNITPQGIEQYVGAKEVVLWVFFRETTFVQKYNNGILAIFPSYVDVADLDEAEKELGAEFGKLEKA